ncbi:MAG: HD domain-containing protein [Candidatus Omnitrophica bacterium]|nr:HD domain-containing protein [Candidatus Omnitrophota bacterium]
MVIKENLYDIYGKLIAKKGERVTRSLVERIKNMPKKSKVRKAMKNTFIYNDVKKTLNNRKYGAIFEGPIKKERILKIAGNTILEDGIIKELAYMKKHLPYTYKHELIVGILTIKMTLGLKKYHLNSRTASYGAFTHDIGKNRIPKKTLGKTSALNVDEYEFLRTHPTIGYLLLLRYERKADAKSSITAYQHHEKLDGSGYPNGIRRINTYAQLVSVNDILDALLAKRPYRKKAFKLRVALDYLLEEVSAKRLNKDAVYSLISYARKEKPHIKTMKISKVMREKPPKQSVYGKIIHALLH